MADFTQSGGVGGYYGAPDQHAPGGASVIISFANVAGALLSLALVVGIAVWGYKLLVRDVSGIPVVRAVSGEMRVRPEDPGGQLARHQGLSVNAVAAEGAAAAPADRLILAPQPIDLEAEDQPILATADPSAAAQDVLQPAPVVNGEAVASTFDDAAVADLVERLTAGVAPQTDLTQPTDEVVASVDSAVIAEVTAAERAASALADLPGVRQSYRPRQRPAAPARAETTPAAAPQGVQEVDPASLAAGTRLAQLGAFDSADVARAQWDVLAGRFDAYLNGKQRIVQKATSGGRVFYRLRAMGFEDIADARRFCAALVAENTDCIPVVTR